jgi:hypothetical protein
MTLLFPTLAEQALTLFTSRQVKSIPAAAKAMGDFEVERRWPGQKTYIFEDDTSLVVTGTGVSHNVEVHLP